MSTIKCGMVILAISASAAAQTQPPAERSPSSSLLVPPNPNPNTNPNSAAPVQPPGGVMPAEAPGVGLWGVGAAAGQGAVGPLRPPHALRAASMFAIAPPEPRAFELHDLVQIIVRETSKAESTHELETDKEYDLNGEVSQWTNLQDLFDLRATTDDDDPRPQWGVEFTKEFNGEGDYKREDDLTARLTAEVIEVLPNGNLVLEARTHIKTDEEEQTIKVTGICRQEDVTAANTVLSNQIHDLAIEKMHKGELNKATQKGIIAKVLDTVFAF